MERFAKDTPKHFPEHFKVHLQRLNDWVVEEMGKTLCLLLGGVVLLLVVGCGNVAILLLARGTVRQQELAVRCAIGASRSRVTRQLLTEALVLALTGAVFGVLAAFGILAGIRLRVGARLCRLCSRGCGCFGCHRAGTSCRVD
jgi:hypothetical protein